MEEGALLFGYLRMPLHSKKLSTLDCKALVDKITSRVAYWSNKMVSYARRLELIKSVIRKAYVAWENVC